jgi:hypothetical protein
MRTMREGVTPLLGAAAAAAFLASAPLHAQQSEAFPATLYFGTGLITTPVAWVSPRSGDVWLNTSAKNLPSIPNAGDMNTMTRYNTNIAIDSHWWGRVSIGAVAYSQNPEWGFFGQGLLLRQGDLGLSLPSVAVGVRNVGKYSHQDRFFIGEDVTLNGNQYDRFVDERYSKFSTSNTVYAVATQNFALGRQAGGPALSLNLGWGNGLFGDDGDLGAAYNRRGTLVKGLFFGARAVMHPSLNTTVSLLAENDAWDYNAGVQVDWRGLTLGVYGTELEEGGGRGPQGFYIYNYTKFNLSLGYSGNVYDIANGVILRSRITELTREQTRLRYEIADRNRRIRGLEVALGRAQASELASLDNRRLDLERQVQEEREAVRRAEARLRQLELNQQRQTPPATRPPTTPPSF